jgi:hypothetical protein
MYGNPLCIGNNMYIEKNLGKYNDIRFVAFRSSDTSHLITFSWMIEVMVSSIEWVQSDSSLNDFWVISIGLETLASDLSMGAM